MDLKNRGKFTVCGSEQVEELITSMMKQIASTIDGELEGIAYEALVLIGGYGRGEGGVAVVDGVEKPHNNFDFLLITKRLPAGEITRLKQKLMQKLQEVISQIKIGIDISIINACKLRSNSCRVIWYDMRFGHKTILGNQDFVPSLRRFKLENIPDWDARNLMINRGTLMVINDLLLQAPALQTDYKKLIIKHIVKAIIGYGDTLLYFLGDYDWSYVEKQKRMQKREEVDAEFKAIYNEAMNFRFKPNYDEFLQKDLVAWSEVLRRHFEEIFLKCEQIRLGKSEISWSNYAQMAFRFALTDEITSIKPLIKKILLFTRNRKTPFTGSFISKLGFKTLDDAGVLPVLFPLVAYKVEDAEFRKIAAAFLNSKSSDFEDLRKAYLRYWSNVGDSNFINVLNHYGISLKD